MCHLLLVVVVLVSLVLGLVWLLVYLIPLLHDDGDDDVDADEYETLLEALLLHVVEDVDGWCTVAEIYGLRTMRRGDVGCFENPSCLFSSSPIDCSRRVHMD